MSSGRLFWQIKGVINWWASNQSDLGEDFFSDVEIQSLANEIKKVLVNDGWKPPDRPARHYYNNRDYDDGTSIF